MAGDSTHDPAQRPAHEVLREASALWLTTLRADGSPHTTPVWFLHETGRRGDRVWIATGERNTKAANAARDDRVSVAFDGTASTPLVGEGRVVVHDIDSVPDSVIDGLAAKYDGWDVRDESVDGRRVVLEVVIERWLLTP